VVHQEHLLGIPAHINNSVSRRVTYSHLKYLEYITTASYRVHLGTRRTLTWYTSTHTQQCLQKGDLHSPEVPGVHYHSIIQSAPWYTKNTYLVYQHTYITVTWYITTALNRVHRGTPRTLTWYTTTHTQQCLQKGDLQSPEVPGVHYHSIIQSAPL